MQTRPKRYQECGFWGRRWRDRYLLLVPYYCAKTYFKFCRSPLYLSWASAWSVARGYCDCDREYWYSFEEVEAMLRHVPEKG